MALALLLSLEDDMAPGGVFSLGGMQPLDLSTLKNKVGPAIKKTPILMSNGVSDTKINFKAARLSVEPLVKEGYNIDLKSIDCQDPKKPNDGHILCEGMQEHLRQFFKKYAKKGIKY